MKYRMVYFPWVILDQSIWGLWWAMVQLCEDHLALRNRCLQNTPGEFPLTERIEGIIVKLSSWPSGMISNKARTKIEMTSSRWQYWVELDTWMSENTHGLIFLLAKIANRNMQMHEMTTCKLWVTIEDCRRNGEWKKWSEWRGWLDDTPKVVTTTIYHRFA